MEAELKVNYKRLSEQFKNLENKQLQESVRLLTFGVLASGAIIGASRLPWVQELIRNARELEEEKARKRILEDGPKP